MESRPPTTRGTRSHQVPSIDRRRAATALGRALVAALALAASGCDQAVDIGWNVDGSQPSLDGSRAADASDASPADGAPRDATTDADTARDAEVGSPCDAPDAEPAVAVGIAGTERRPSAIRVFRGAGDRFESCGARTAAESLGVPFALTWIDARRLLVGSSDGLELVDVVADGVLAEGGGFDSRSVPRDAFATVDANGESIAMTTGPAHHAEILYLDGLTAAGAPLYRMLADLDTRSVLTCDADPRAPHAIWCTEALWLDRPRALVELSMFGVRANGAEVLNVPRAALRRMDLGPSETVWIERIGNVDWVRTRSRADDAAFDLPTMCETDRCAEPRSLVDVAVDPTRAASYFAVCDARGGGRVLVRGRMRERGACEHVLEPSMLDPHQTITSVDTWAP